MCLTAFPKWMTGEASPKARGGVIMNALPDFTTPEALADHLGWSPRRVREVARRLGACRIIGNRMILLPDDVKAIMEASKPCPSSSTDAAKSGTIAAPLPGGDYEALRAL